MIYLFILVAKIIEVSMATVRIVLITKGERLIGAIIGVVEVAIWIFLAGTVITNISEDPLKAVFYAIGFGIGNYLGSLIEEKLGIGTAEVQAIVLEEHGQELADLIRNQGYAVTVVDGQGMNHKRNILFTFISRKKVHSLVKLIQASQENVVITISESKPVYGGFGTVRK
jgi:uncharacterized protein YebE (UPF0316 family)